VDQTQPAVRDISNHCAPCGDSGKVEGEPRRILSEQLGGAGPSCMALRSLLLSRRCFAQHGPQRALPELHLLLTLYVHVHVLRSPHASQALAAGL